MLFWASVIELFRPQHSYIVVFGNLTLCLTSIKISFILENCNQKPLVGHLVNRQHSLLLFILVHILVDDV